MADAATGNRYAGSEAYSEDVEMVSFRDRKVSSAFIRSTFRC